jgi:hypothetical protein
MLFSHEKVDRLHHILVDQTLVWVLTLGCKGCQVQVGPLRGISGRRKEHGEGARVRLRGPRSMAGLRGGRSWLIGCVAGAGHHWLPAAVNTVRCAASGSPGRTLTGRAPSACAAAASRRGQATAPASAALRPPAWHPPDAASPATGPCGGGPTASTATGRARAGTTGLPASSARGAAHGEGVRRPTPDECRWPGEGCQSSSIVAGEPDVACHKRPYKTCSLRRTFGQSHDAHA